MNRSKMSRIVTDVNSHRARHASGVNPHASPNRPTYAMIAVTYAAGNRTRPPHIRTKVSLDTEPVDSSLGNAILEAIRASGVRPTEAVVTVSFS